MRRHPKATGHLRQDNMDISSHHRHIRDTASPRRRLSTHTDLHPPSRTAPPNLNRTAHRMEGPRKPSTASTARPLRPLPSSMLRNNIRPRLLLSDMAPRRPSNGVATRMRTPSARR